MPGTLPRLFGALLLLGGAGVGCSSSDDDAKQPPSEGKPVPALGRVIPAPASVKPGGNPYVLTETTAIRIDDAREVRAIGEYLAGLLRPSTGYPLPLTTDQGTGGILLQLSETEGSLGDEGYRLTSSGEQLTLVARKPAGLFYGVQTLRQLLPAAVEKDSRQDGPWEIPGGTVTDAPRYSYRGGMLDVARHFFTVDQVKRYIDQLALYKINKLHLHLTDDQGWRLAIDSWPRLTAVGGSTQTGGGSGGYYTKAQYTEIVEYAGSRYLEVIPEIDGPGHTNAVLASYAELNCKDTAPPLYTGIDVGFSSLCVDKPATYDFLDDVIREVAAITPGKYIHIGGDEADNTSHEDYVTFMDKAQAIVLKYGKTVMGWHQLAGAEPVAGAVVQYWGYGRTEAPERELVAATAKKGTLLVLSPADRTYLDHKYTSETGLGLQWAGLVEVDQAYKWDPANYLKDVGVEEHSVLGVEAPLWTETLATSSDLEVMAFPRLPGVAERGWSEGGEWDEYKLRLAGHGPRWDAMGIKFYKSPVVPWPKA
ncbi:beta-N-acetylhexosaminidase [Streptomyces albipurpureus]|uniref:beta-N-acetylhexosaminidase n=1 Tax=Streptomyces albipurpureus TaxID=2897419 RepID=A0ABT0UUA1_9ACTN|nr:beta-N-acetylhexosaminidase [Streptomyces sp. CWNU-1]MCM2392167.1 beta-N-acetylhexosaminidase [Streptomyces sp. CWNU-1]